jgi:hypothetical protein
MGRKEGDLPFPVPSTPLAKPPAPVPSTPLAKPPASVPSAPLAKPPSQPQQAQPTVIANLLTHLPLAQTEAVLAAAKGGPALPGPLGAAPQSAFGQPNLSDVRVHTNMTAPGTTLGAVAYTTGSPIGLGEKSSPAPIAHEIGVPVQIGTEAGVPVQIGTEAGEGGCFGPETLIATGSDAFTPIKALKSDDLVMSRDEHTGLTDRQRVVRKWTHEQRPTVAITIDGGEVICTTHVHRFFAADKGLVAVSELNVGDYIRTLSGDSVRIVSIKPDDEVSTVYNLTVENFHTYFVGRSRVWVHNAKKEPGT